MLTTIHSMGLLGLHAYPVQIEIDLSHGMCSFEIVGLPDAAVKESRDRVRSAIKNCGFRFPSQKIIINLAPADIKKTGPLYDLPLLIGLLQASGQISFDLNNTVFLGELSLGGKVRHITGALPMITAARDLGFQQAFLPKQNALEAGVVRGISAFGVSHVEELLQHLEGRKKLTPARYRPQPKKADADLPDFSDVKGQLVPRRALEIAAAGNHNLLLIGPPGSGKSMLAKRLPSILPTMSFREAVETANIYSVAGLMDEEQPLSLERPFRSPHHTISSAGLAGGSMPPRPGEISLAHNGVLFLDELPEFRRDVKEILRQPMEDDNITLARSSYHITYPCSVMVVAAMNPCPCGYYGHPTRECRCSSNKVMNYLSKVSGPFLDRLDLHVEVSPVEYDSFRSAAKAESSQVIRKRVEKVRQLQQQRYQSCPFSTNGRMTSSAIQRYCPLSEKAHQTLKFAFEKLGLSARAHNRILKLARTIADLEYSEQIEQPHIAEAIQYRSLDRKYWSPF